MHEKWATQLPRHRTSAMVARGWVEQHLGGMVDEDGLHDVKLLVTELVDNAYVHGKGKIQLFLERRAERLRVEVVDDGEGAAVKIREDGTDLGGYGLKIVEQLSSAWGAFEGTTHVWAEMTVQ